MEDFEAYVEVLEEKILFELKCTRKEYKESRAPSQGFLHTDLYETGSVNFQKCYLTVEVIFLNDHFYSVYLCPCSCSCNMTMIMTRIMTTRITYYNITQD